MSLTAIALVVFLVSVPSLRGFALRQNEVDAVSLIRALGQASLDSSKAGPTTIGALFKTHPDLGHRFGDLEYLEDQALLRTHGYLFDLVTSPAGPIIRAWPWCWGRTGHAALVHTQDGKILGHANPNGLWSGCTATPNMSAPLTAGWSPMQ